MKFYFAVLLLAIFCTNLSAAPLKNVTGTVYKIQVMGVNYTSYSTEGEAIAFIYVDALPAACGSANNFRRIAITSNHPAYSSALSTALAAKASGAPVHMYYVEECTLWNQNAWDFATITIQ